MKTFKITLEKNSYENYLPELLSKLSEKMPLTEDNILINSLVEAVATIPLNNIEFGRLSIAGLQCLLTYIHEKETHLATSEYDVFRYSAILAARQVSDNAYNTLMEQLPTLEQIKQIKDLVQLENKIVTEHQKVAKELEPLVKLIDFRRIKGPILVNIIEPLSITPAEIILNVYRYNTLSSNSDLNDTRGMSSNYVFDESVCGSKLIIEDNGKIVRASNNLNSYRSIRAQMVLENKGIFEWDVIIEKFCTSACVGVCVSENFDYGTWAGYQTTGWVLSAQGSCVNSNNWTKYCPTFGEGAIITVHLDMNKRTCSFTVNGTKYSEVSTWNNLPSKLYPVVSLMSPGQFRIQPH